MHIWRVLKLVGLLIFFLGLFMAAPLCISLISRDGSASALISSM